MNLDEVNATIRELESQIASYELEISQTSHSTPVGAPSGDNQATDSGFATSNAQDGTDFDEKSGAKRKSVSGKLSRIRRKRRKMNSISALS